MSYVTFIKPQPKNRIQSVVFGIVVLVTIIVSGFFVLEEYGLVPYLIILIATISALVLWHSRTRGYQCTNCTHEFEISFWRGLPTIHSIFFEKKMATCPACKFRGYATELVKVTSD